MTILQGQRGWVRGGMLLGTVALVLSACAATDQVAAYPYPESYPYGVYADPPPYDGDGFYDNGWYLGDGFYDGGFHHHFGHGVGHFAGGHFGGGHFGGGHFGGGHAGGGHR